MSFRKYQHVNSTIHISVICDECKEQKEVLYDPNHDTIFCGSCGVILKENFTCKMKNKRVIE